MKDIEYYESLDKRTKEYKEWKATFKAKQEENQPEGLGDVVAEITKATGIDKVAEKVANALGYDDCGCDERRKKWNKAFNFNKQPECPTEEEFTYLRDYFAVERDKITYEDRVKIYAIYNRVFRRAERPTSCTACFMEKVNMLKKLIS